MTSLPSEQEIEAMVWARGLNHPRLSPGWIDTIVRASEVFYHQFPGTTVTVCCLVLPNRFCLIGQASCVSPENFDAEIGKRIAFEDARQQVWRMEGYLLMQQLAFGAEARGAQPRYTPNQYKMPPQAPPPEGRTAQHAGQWPPENGDDAWKTRHDR